MADRFLGSEADGLDGVSKLLFGEKDTDQSERFHGNNGQVGELSTSWCVHTFRDNIGSWGLS